MVKHTQTIPWQQPTNYSSVFNYFEVLAIKGLKNRKNHRISELRVSSFPLFANLVREKSQ